MKRVGSAPSCLMAAAAANDRRNLRGTRDRAVDLPRLEDDGAPLPQAALGERHHLDHALIGLARILAEGEDAVLVQDQPFDFARFASNTAAAALARPKPGAM